MEITVRNVNNAMEELLWRLKTCFKKANSRNGPVIKFPEPVMVTYTHPTERVLFWEERDCNPIFHLMESMWILGGGRDVKFPEMFNSQIAQYSDDGKVFNAAYGYRMREHFGVDQLLDVVDLLADDPTSRQAVIQLWSAEDLNKITKDKCCNTQMVFEVEDGRLNMTVFNRSNDLWYGMLGANVVHFSYILEFVALAAGYEVGLYRQFTTNLHLYTELYNQPVMEYVNFPPKANIFNHYGAYKGVHSTPLLDHGEDYWMLLRDIYRFLEDPFNEQDYTYETNFVRTVCVPMARIKQNRSMGLTGLGEANLISSPDWRIAAEEWVLRRELALATKAG